MTAAELNTRTSASDVDISIRPENVEIKRQRNARTPIYRLPPEILATVFTQVQHEFDYAPRARRFIFNYAWTRVTLVCHHFYHVAVATPTLWTLVDFAQKSREWTDLCIRRSADVSLCIAVSDADHVDLWNRSESAYLLNETATELLDTSAPRVKTLFIDPEEEQVPINSFSLRNVCTTLVHLELTGPGVIVEGAPFMPTLRCLDLQNITTHTSFANLADFLTQTPNIETLVAQGLYLLHDQSVVDAAVLMLVPKQVVLPRLQHLYIEDTPAEAGALVRLLPEPSLAFGVRVLHVRQRGVSIGQNEEYTYNAWIQYWRRRSLVEENPQVTITFNHAYVPRTVGVISCGLVKGGQDVRHQPTTACFFSVQWNLLGAHTMLDRVVTICLCGTEDDHDVPHEDLDGAYGVRFLPALRTLNLQDLHINSDSRKIQNIRSWVASREGKIKCVRFIECGSQFEAISDAWREEGVAAEVLWLPLAGECTSLANADIGSWA
jgi:hypothetical protein